MQKPIKYVSILTLLYLIPISQRLSSENTHGILKSNNQNLGVKSEPVISNDWFVTDNIPQKTTYRGFTEDTVFWKECEGKAKGSYSNEYSDATSFEEIYPKFESWKSLYDVEVTKGECKNNQVVSKEFFDFLQSHLPSCVALALNVSLDAIENLHISHIGTLQEKDMSLHSIARAIDITGFDISIKGERSTQKFNHAMAANAAKLKSEEKRSDLDHKQIVFWAKFKSCVESNGAGTISYEDEEHEGHIHMSLRNEKTIKKGFYDI